MTDSNSDDGEYVVGYGKPPKHTQFKHGQSGNPSGRKKKNPSVSASILDVLDEKMQVTINGARKRVRIGELAVRKLIEIGLKGNVKVLLALLKLVPEELERQAKMAIATQSQANSQSGSREALDRFLKVLDVLAKLKRYMSDEEFRTHFGDADTMISNQSEDESKPIIEKRDEEDPRLGTRRRPPPRFE